MRYKSIFEIMGPVMVGPSSSHTAGAVKIGQIARNIFGGDWYRADITFFGSFAHTYKGQLGPVPARPRECPGRCR